MQDNVLDFAIQNNLNVLFKGMHGVGKTARVIEAFERNGIRWKYFSAPTIDPWVDLVGIPSESTGENKHIEFVRPAEFANDEIEAIFIDEYNRAPKKVMNAVMELIQFKSINGKKFNNLKIVWAAINENNEEDMAQYHVEELDPAQADRFEIHINVPFALDTSYLSRKWGAENSRTISEWWGALPEKVRHKVSPRRVDYALKVYNAGGDINYVLPKEANVKQLISVLKSGSYTSRIESFANKTAEEIRSMINRDTQFKSHLTENVLTDKVTAYYKPGSETYETIVSSLNREALSKVIMGTDGAKLDATGATNSESIFGILQSALDTHNASRSRTRPKWMSENIVNAIKNRAMANAGGATQAPTPTNVRTSLPDDAKTPENDLTKALDTLYTARRSATGAMFYHETVFLAAVKDCHSRSVLSHYVTARQVEIAKEEIAGIGAKSKSLADLCAELTNYLDSVTVKQ